MSETCNGFPKINIECLLSNITCGDGEEIRICDSEECTEEAIKFADKMFAYYIGNDKDVEQKFRLDRYGCYVCAWASIIRTLSESDGKESYMKLKAIPKYVSKSKLVEYLIDTFMDKYETMTENTVFMSVDKDGIEEIVKNAMDVYEKYVKYRERGKQETIYTRLYEESYGNKKKLYTVRINQFPDVEEWIKFAKSDYEVDLLMIPKKWREVIYEKDEVIEKLSERGNETEMISDETIDDEIENETEKEIGNETENEVEIETINELEKEV